MILPILPYILSYHFNYCYILIININQYSIFGQNILWKIPKIASYLEPLSNAFQTHICLLATRRMAITFTILCFKQYLNHHQFDGHHQNYHQNLYYHYKNQYIYNYNLKFIVTISDIVNYCNQCCYGHFDLPFISGLECNQRIKYLFTLSPSLA